MFFHPKSLKSENNNPRFNILPHTQSAVCATVDSQCVEYLGHIALAVDLILSFFFQNWFFFLHNVAKSVSEVELDLFPPEKLKTINIKLMIQKFWKYQLSLRLEYKKKSIVAL